MMNLSHDLVSILYTIRGMSECYLEKAQGGDLSDKELEVQKAIDAFQRINRQSEQALAIVKKLRLYMKDSGICDRGRQRVSIRRVWQEMLRKAGKNYDLSGIEIIEHIPEDFPLLCCKRNDLREIFHLIIENALHALAAKSQEEKIMVIRAQWIHSQKDEPYASISISDNGTGIPEKCLKNLFQPFFTTKEDAFGNGLGLYLANQLVRKNHGDIRIMSFEKFGTTVTLDLPVAASIDKKS